MTLYIAEYDEKQKIAAVWVKETTARGPRVFDPKQHVFEAGPSAEFFGAPRREIEKWVADVSLRGRLSR